MAWEAFGSQTQLPRGLSRRSAAARLLGFEYQCGYKTFTSCEMLCVVQGSPTECVRVSVCSQVQQ
jgi:hypothetical protein